MRNSDKKLVSLILKRIRSFLFRCFNAVLRRVPTRKTLWIFGAWAGKLYADNSKAMFEFVNANHPEIDAVWITGDKAVEEKVNSLGYKCYHCDSLRGRWAIARAAVAFETEGEWDISQYLNIQKTKVVQLWHGVGYKAMKWKSSDGVITTEEKNNRERFSSYYWVSTSELYTNIIFELLGVPKEKFVITGYPRNDNIVAAPHNAYMDQLKDNYQDCKFLIYMPTHRNFGASGNEWINFAELKRVDAMLRERKLVMVYKPHLHELKNFLQYENAFTNIIMAKEQEIWGDVYTYLHYFDLLISDYSSVLTDFMCTGKPIVLFPYDLDNYINGDAGLNSCFWDIPGGPLCYTWDDVIETSSSLLENDHWKEERERCRIQYHYFNDGKNCERVYNMTKAIIENSK